MPDPQKTGYLTWNADLDTGIDEIDGQHRQIVDYINQLYDAQESGDRAAIGGVIEATVAYTVSHFGYEEALMTSSGYEFTRPHTKVHELFIRRVSDLRGRFEAGDEVGGELHGLLARWLFGHIRNDDAAYARVIGPALRSAPREEEKKGWFSRSLEKVFG